MLKNLKKKNKFLQDQQLTDVILFNSKLSIISKISSFRKEHGPEECEK